MEIKEIHNYVINLIQLIRLKTNTISKVYSINLKPCYI